MAFRQRRIVVSVPNKLYWFGQTLITIVVDTVIGDGQVISLLRLAEANSQVHDVLFNIIYLALRNR